MSVQDPLAALRPLHPPAPIDWWPPAPGWWALGALLLVSMGWAIWYRKRSALRRAALTELRRLAQDEPDDTRLSAGVNQLLRRVALAYFPHKQVAGLSGKAWLEFLEAQAKCTGFVGGPGRVLATAPYAVAVQLDRAALLELARRWIYANCRGRS
jgi:hypothetical protein